MAHRYLVRVYNYMSLILHFLFAFFLLGLAWSLFAALWRPSGGFLEAHLGPSGGPLGGLMEAHLGPKAVHGRRGCRKGHFGDRRGALREAQGSTQNHIF